jgi:hypothetical protein
MSKPPLVSLRWLDAHATAATSAYETHELPHRAAEVTTYGLLLRDDEQGISIASEDIGAGMYRGITFVPRQLIIHMKHLQRPRKRKTDAPLD